MPPSLGEREAPHMADKGGVGLLVVQLQNGTVFQVWKKTCAQYFKKP